MSASNTCDGCSQVVFPEEPLLDTWMVLWLPKEPEPVPDGFMDMGQMMAMLQGGGKPKQQYHRLEFCSWRCVSTKALAMVLSQQVNFNNVIPEQEGGR